jgi:hypothetical protein
MLARRGRLTDQTTNSIFDSFRTDIGDRQAFLDEVHRWKTRWNMVDGQNPQTLLETLNMSQTKNIPACFPPMNFIKKRLSVANIRTKRIKD